MQEELKFEYEAVKVPERTARILKEMYNAGYRYIARCEGMKYITCYFPQPTKFRSLEIWGYKNPDAPDVLPAYPLVGIDLPDVKWSNKFATLIEIFLEDGEIS